jgi:hypothetical protein
MRAIHPVLAFAMLMVGCGSCDDVAGWSFEEPSEQLVDAAMDAAEPLDGGRAASDVGPGADMPAAVDASLPTIADAGPPVPQLELDCRGRLPQSEEVLTRGTNDAIRFDAAVGPNGCPHVVWSLDSEVRYAVWTGDEWVRERVAPTTEYEVSLAVDDLGVPTVYIATDKPGFVGLRREAGWTITERLGERWTWHLSSEQTMGRSTVVLVDATQQNSGTDRRLRVGVRSPSGWSFDRIGDFDLGSFMHRQRMAVDTSGIGYLAFLQNKGFGPTNRASNLWLARSDSPDLTGWTWERVGEEPYNRFRFPSVFAIDGQLQIVAIYDPLGVEGDSIVRGTRSPSGWEWETLVDCGADTCSFTSAVDVFGRLHLAYGLRNGSGFRFSEFYRLGTDPTSDVPLGTSSKSLLRVDPVDGTPHLVTSERMGQAQPPHRQLRWVPL